MSETQPPLEDWYKRVRPTDPETSHEAAKSLDAATLSDIQVNIHTLLKLRPMCHEDLIEAYNRTYPPKGPSTIRTRCSELVRGGFVVDSGARSKLPSGRETIIWRVS